MREQIKLTPDAPLKTVSLDWTAGYLGIHNLTPYPIYVTYGVTPPSASTYDLLIPAATVMSAPLPGNQTYSFFMDTSGVAVTFSSPPAVLTLDSEPVNYGFSQVHLTYPFSNNLQFIARTRQADQYYYGTLGTSSGVVTLITLGVPVGEIWIIRRVWVTAVDPAANNQAYISVRVTRPLVLDTPVFYRWFSAADLGQLFELRDLAVMVPEKTTVDNLTVIGRNYSATNPITFEIKLQVDVYEASLP